MMNDATAAGGRAIWNPDRGQSKVSPPAATPANYFETTFTATAGVPYHLWVRLRAQGNSTSNNSVNVQFDDAIDRYGSQLYRIGTTTGAEIVLQDPSGTLNNWGWDDNTLTSPPTLIYFPFTGPHTLRVQQRTDGAIVDQIVLSPDAFLSSRPGGTKSDATIYGSTLDGAPPPDPGTPPPPPPPPIPAPWAQQDIGAVGMPGYAEFDDAAATFSVVGAGADVWGTADALHYVYQPLSGDGSIVARVDAVSNTDPWVKAGVMIRESLQPGAARGFMLVSFSKGLAFQRRKIAGARVGEHDRRNRIVGRRAVLGPPRSRRLDDRGVSVEGRRHVEARRQRHVHDAARCLRRHRRVEPSHRCDCHRGDVAGVGDRDAGAVVHLRRDARQPVVLAWTPRRRPSRSTRRTPVHGRPSVTTAG